MFYIYLRVSRSVTYSSERERLRRRRRRFPALGAPPLIVTPTRDSLASYYTRAHAMRRWVQCIEVGSTERRPRAPERERERAPVSRSLAERPSKRGFVNM